MFFAQFMIQAGVFFAVPLFLSVVLGLNALQTGVRLVPLSIALLVAAVGIPKLWPQANPRRVVRIGLLLLIVGIGFLVAGMDPDADAAVLNIPMVLMGLGLGRAGLAAGRGHRVRGVGRGDRRGRRAAEHRHQPRGLDGHRADRLGADRDAEHRGADRIAVGRVALDLYPGQIFRGTVDSIWRGNGIGQYLPSDDVPKFQPPPPNVPQGQYAVKIRLDHPWINPSFE